MVTLTWLARLTTYYTTPNNKEVYCIIASACAWLEVIHVDRYEELLIIRDTFLLSYFSTIFLVKKNLSLYIAPLIGIYYI